MKTLDKIIKAIEYSIKFIKYSQNICYTAGIILSSTRDPVIFTLNKKNTLVLLIETHIKPIGGSKAKPRSFSKTASPSALWEYLLCMLHLVPHGNTRFAR